MGQSIKFIDEAINSIEVIWEKGLVPERNSFKPDNLDWKQKIGKNSITSRYVRNDFKKEYKSSQQIELQRLNLPIKGTDKWVDTLLF